MKINQNTIVRVNLKKQCNKNECIPKTPKQKQEEKIKIKNHQNQNKPSENRIPKHVGKHHQLFNQTAHTINLFSEKGERESTRERTKQETQQNDDGDDNKKFL